MRTITETTLGTTDPDSQKSKRQALSVTPAGTFEELCEAFRLVYQEYTKCGYITSNPGMMHYSVLQLLPTSRTYIALSSGRLIGTGTVVVASPAGMPSAEVFGDVFESLAQAGRTVAEATMLACLSTERSRAADVSREIIPHAIRWAVSQGADDWCVVVNPKHVAFWRDRLGMETLAEPRTCHHVCGHPGILLRLPLREIMAGQVRPSPDLRLLLDGIEDESPTAAHRLTHNEMMTLMVQKPDLFDRLSLRQWSLLREHYPRALALAGRLC
jgi:hypothetical protein